MFQREGARAAKPAPGPNTLRDHLANERTLLAWVRTSVAMMGMGFVVAKFAILLRELLGRHAHILTETVGNWIGVLLVLSGVATASFAIINFERVRHGIDYGEIRFSPVLALTAGAIVVAVSLILTLYLVVTGPGIG
jgi:putative membrane protein